MIPLLFKRKRTHKYLHYKICIDYKITIANFILFYFPTCPNESNNFFRNQHYCPVAKLSLKPSDTILVQGLEISLVRIVNSFQRTL